MEEISSNKLFGGFHKRFKHKSAACACEMTFAVYLPPQAQQQNLPVVYWLSGLTCNDENFSTKAGAQAFAAELGLILVMPDTSPRNTGIESEDAEYDIGTGAGFYINATQAPWHKHYQMYDYVLEELPDLIDKNFPVDRNRQSISGHSMGGHGALTLALKNPGRFRSVSAFAPICAPSQVPWGQKIFAAYLGAKQDAWQDHDATALIGKGSDLPPCLIDQGDHDQYLSTQLKPELLQKVAAEKKLDLSFRTQSGYDHSYFFIASFIGDHLKFHARYLG